MNLDITTSDYNDQEIEDNIAYNSTTNGITPALPHIKRESPFHLHNHQFLWVSSSEENVINPIIPLDFFDHVSHKAAAYFFYEWLKIWDTFKE